MPTGEILALLVLHLALTALPMAAAALLGARAGLRSVPVLLALALAVGALVGFLSFWAYYGGRTLGETASWLALLGSVAAIGWALRAGIERRLLLQLAVPLALWALASVFLVFLGFAHGGADQPLAASLARFSHTLPSDSQIPYFYAEWFFENGHSPKAPVFPGDWLFSDRPPLQVGYVLSQRPFGFGGNELSYQVLGVVLQQLWVIGLWALLLAARIGRLSRGLAMLAVATSGLALVNGFFVWPKLLPAALLLALAALVLTPLWEEVRGNLWGAALAAALAALAMLGHGSSVFGILPLAAVAAWRGLPSPRWIGVGLGVAIVLVGSWSAYQRYADPPGNRLVKWTLAGEPAIDDRGVLETVADAYSAAGIDGTIENKKQNLLTIVGVEATVDAIEIGFDGEAGQFARSLRSVQFFNLVPALGLFLLGPVLMAVGWRRRSARPQEWSLAVACLAVFALGAVLWGLLIFGNEVERSVVHVGSYLLPLLGIVGCVAGLRAVAPRFAPWWVGGAAALGLALYAPALDPVPGSSYSAIAIVLAALAFAGFAWLVLRDPTAPDAASA